mmetsp:Transcript_100825/g.174151  ORF Transcript_100825/g.174151 Transcript_100825/m.174151 type:complete len:142 (+) Transcript_100825:1113-1538(+)
MVLRAAHQRGHLQVVQACLTAFAPRYTGTLHAKALAPLFMRYFNIALRVGYLERAWSVAHQLQSQEMLDAVCARALTCHAPSLQAVALSQLSAGSRKGLEGYQATLAVANKVLGTDGPSTEEVEQQLHHVRLERTKLLASH